MNVRFILTFILKSGKYMYPVTALLIIDTAITTITGHTFIKERFPLYQS